MSNKNKDVSQKEVVQAVIVADSFSDEFIPLTNDIPLALLPLVNVPLIDYALEFLSLGGIEETFLFCCSHVDVIKEHIQARIEQSAGWSLTMKVKIIVSESCRSFGDCLRDLDAKALIRGDFVLLEPGTVGNIKLLTFIKKHIETTKTDKGAAMTLILQEAGSGQMLHHANEELLIASTPNNRLLFHQKIRRSHTRRIDLPLEILVDNPTVNIQHNLKDTHISICSPSVLPLFSDNFDFQTRDDFVRGLLMNEEILGSTIYWQQIKGSQYGACVTNWRMYQAISHDVIHRWLYPLVPDMGISTQQRKYIHLKNNIYRNKDVQLAKNSSLIEDVIIGAGSSLSDGTTVTKSVIGECVKIGKNVRIEDSFVFSNVAIDDNTIITHSVIGPNCIIASGSRICAGSVLGKGVSVIKDTVIDDSLVQAHKPESSDLHDVLGYAAYRIKHPDHGETTDSEDEELAKQISRLHLGVEPEESDEESISSESENPLSYTNSPIPDDTNLFLTEVIDSLARGFEDKLQCDNLILEINSSRYAYNVTVKEVNFNVVKAILMLPFQQSIGQQYLQSLRPLLAYFSSILMNYIRNDSAMVDCLQAIEDVAGSNNELNECVAAVLKWFYDKDHLSEEAILKWFTSVDQQSRLHARIKPFVDWLEEAEEETSEEDED